MEQAGAPKGETQSLQAALDVGADQRRDLHLQHLAAAEAAKTLGHRIDVAQQFGRGVEKEESVAGFLEEAPASSGQ